MSSLWTCQFEELARNQMWASLIPGYQEADRNKKKKLKKEYNMSGFNEVPAGLMTNTKWFTFDTCVAQESMPSAALCKKATPRKGNDNMYVEQNMTVKEKTTEDVRREHFLDELNSIYSKKDTELREKFGLSVPKSPKTPKELVEWIKAGEYTFIKDYDPDEDETWCVYEPILHGFRWTKVKEDRKGYDEAFKALHVELKKFQNEVWAELEPANFIKILDKFEKVKIH